MIMIVIADVSKIGPNEDFDPIRMGGTEVTAEKGIDFSDGTDLPGSFAGLMSFDVAPAAKSVYESKALR